MFKETEIKDRILHAATAEFAEKGYRGATLRGIAVRIDVTAALINYHFGSKERLAEAVIEMQRHAISVPVDGDISCVDSDMSWRALLRSFVNAVIAAFTSADYPNCYFAALYRHEAATIGDKKVTLHDQCLMPVYERLEKIVAMGVKSGDRYAVRLWSLTLWNLILALALKDGRRVGEYIPEGISPKLFQTLSTDFMIDQVLSGLHFERAAVA